MNEYYIIYYYIIGFEILDEVLSDYQKNKIAPLNNFLTPLFNPTMINLGLNLTYPPESINIVQCNLAKADPSPGLAKCFLIAQPLGWRLLHMDSECVKMCVCV